VLLLVVLEQSRTERDRDAARAVREAVRQRLARARAALRIALPDLELEGDAA
jgi:hypothetical protein